MRTALASTLSRVPYSWQLGITVAAALLVVMGAFIATAGTASAAPISEQGDDYAEIDENGNLKVCDLEQDGHGVYAEWQSNSGTGYAWDTNGSKSPCSTYGPVVTFRVCESINWFPDPCGEWV
jgi:hypothetical protein